MSRILQLIEEQLGKGEIRSKGNYTFYCPFCNHYKKKLEIHPELGVWACWVCKSRGKTIKSLFIKLNVSESIHARLKQLTPEKVKFVKEINKADVITLPKDYKPLLRGNNTFFHNMALKYITEQRKCTVGDIYKHNIGYTETSNMLIFPNYDADGNLNYYTTRSYINGASLKFKNPVAPRNIIGFENQLNWQLPLLICESALNAITLRINATPQYGSTLTESIKRAIFDNDVNDIYMCLDPDAWKLSNEYVRYLINFNINVYNVKFPDGYDINKLGYENSWEIINNTRPINEGDVLGDQLKTILQKI